MDKLEKAKAQLEMDYIYTEIDNDCLYVYIGDTLLELSDFEVNYRAQRYDEQVESGDIEPIN